MSPPTAPLPKSVKDVATEAELKDILKQGFLNGSTAGSGGGCETQARTASATDSAAAAAPWVLPDDKFDASCMHENSVAKEARRLLVLKSLLALDEVNDELLDRLTKMASRLLNAPICLVTLVDLGRIWFISNTGLEGMRTIDRAESLCEYSIRNKGDVFIIPDTTKCQVSLNNPVVCGPLNVRFYAAAPLVVDGCSVANFCVMDTKPRGKGLSPSEQDTLRDFAHMAVKVLVDRQFRLQSQSKQEHLVSTTSHDLMTPLMGLNLSLSVLKDDPAVMQKLDANHLEMLHTASTCGDLVSRICKDALNGMRQGTKRKLTSEEVQKNEAVAPAAALKLSDLVSRLDHILRPLRTQVPIIITIDDSAPDSIVCDDLKIVRAALSLLSSASRRTTCGFIRFRVFTNDAKNLTFECQDSASSIDTLSAKEAMRIDDVCKITDSSLVFLNVVSNLANEMGGTAGFRKRADDEEAEQGSIVWFSIPIVGASWTKVDQKTYTRPQKQQKIVDANFESLVELGKPCGLPNNSDASSCLSDSLVSASDLIYDFSSHITDEGRRRKLALVVDDSLVIRKSMGRALSKHGYEVVVAEDGLQGLHELKQKVFDIIFMDFLMPHLDGLDCIRQFRLWEKENRPWVRLHIVGISGHASPRDMEKGTEIGMDDFRAKPIDLKCLDDIAKSPIVMEITQRLDALVLGDGLNGAMGRVVSGSSTSEECMLGYPSFPSAGHLASDKCGDIERHCLIVAPMDEQNKVAASAHLLEQKGWKSCMAATSDEALQLLKSRNWGAVLVGDKLLPESATACIASFRQWESEKRINAQKNVFMLSSCKLDCPDSSDRASLIPPSGFQGVLNLPVPWATFKQLTLDQREHVGGGGVEFIMR